MMGAMAERASAPSGVEEERGGRRRSRSRSALSASLHPLRSAAAHPQPPIAAMHSSSHSAPRRPWPSASSTSASSSSDHGAAASALADLLVDADTLPSAPPSQLFRVPSLGQTAPLSFSSMPRICLQLIYGYLSLNEMGVACRTCRDMAATAALYRCFVNSEKGGIRERWLGLDATHTWTYAGALARSPLRHQVTVFNSLDARWGWLSSVAQLRLLRRMKHLIEVHSHYSPDVPIDWGSEIEALVCRNRPEPTMEEIEQADASAATMTVIGGLSDSASAAAAVGLGAETAASSSDSLPPLSGDDQLPSYMRAISASRPVAPASQLQTLMLCPLSYEEMAAAAEAEAEATAQPSPVGGGAGARLRRAMGAAASKVSSALKAATRGPSASSSSSSSGDETKPEHSYTYLLNPPHLPADPSKEEERATLARWSEVNADLFSRLGRFRSLEVLGLTLRGDCASWDVAGFAHLANLRSLELDMDGAAQYAFGRQLVEIIEFVRDVPYPGLLKLQSTALRSIHLRQLMRPVQDGRPHPPAWTTLQEFMIQSSPIVPPEYADTLAAWESAAEARFWPKATAAATSSSAATGSSSEEKKEATAESSSSSASAAAGTGAGADGATSAAAAPTASAALSADDALALMTPMRNLRAVDLLSFYPCASAAGLRSLSSLSELDTLAVGGAMLSPNQLDLGDPDGLAAQLLQLQFGEQLAGLLPNLPLGSLRHAMVLDDEIVAALGAVGDKGPVKVDRLTLAYIRVPKPEQSEAGQSGAPGSAAAPSPSPSSAAAAAPSALDGSDSPNEEERKESSSAVAAVPTLFHTLLSHFASSLLDLSLDSVLYLDDLSAVAQCLRLETLQLVSLRGLPCESLRQLQPLTKLFSLRISHMFVSASVRREFAVPSALMPSLREFIADGEFDPEEGQEIDGDEEGPQGHGHGHGHGHAHNHHQGMGMGGNLNGILAPALNWLNNLLTQAQNQAAAAAQDDAEDSDGPPELEDEVD